MAALKSTRDQLNAPGKVDLMLVMSGSDRDKLLRLVNSNSAPFYGSQIQHMPELGDDFIAYVASLIETRRPALKPVDQAELSTAFARCGRRAHGRLWSGKLSCDRTIALQLLRHNQSVKHFCGPSSRLRAHPVRVVLRIFCHMSYAGCEFVSGINRRTTAKVTTTTGMPGIIEA